MNGSGLCRYFAAMRDSFWKEVFLFRFQANALALDKQGVTTLNNDHTLIVVMNMFGRRSSFSADPESHLAPVRTVKHVAFNPCSGL